MLTKSGIKVLDFGLAKMDRQAAALGEESRTRSASTQEGTIPGTLHYMAPEQLQGKEVDGCADIFAFGCVLYEILTGQRGFDGENAASIIAAVMERPPPSLTAVAPAVFDRVLKRCLEKSPDLRWQTAWDLKGALELMAGGEKDAPVLADVRRKSLSGNRFMWGVASLLIAATAAAAGWILKPQPARPVSGTVIALGPDEHVTI